MSAVKSKIRTETTEENFYVYSGSERSVTRSHYAIVIFYVYSALWLALSIYIAGFSPSHDHYVANITAGVLVAAVLLHFLAISAATLTDIIFLLTGMAVLIAPIAVLLLHQTASPHLYLAYLAANATVAAFVVTIYTERLMVMPQWLAGMQVAYLVILGLDSLTRAYKPTYPMAYPKILTALRGIADLRLLLAIPIAIVWLSIAILRCRRDGSIDTVPIVWRTDVGLISAIVQLPGRFAAAVATFLAIVLRRIGRDFLYEFRFHALHLGKYLCTIAAVGAMFIGAEVYSPWLVRYLQSPTSFSDFIFDAHHVWLIVTPVVGFVMFLLVPSINAGLAGLWLPQFSISLLLQRSYQRAVAAAVPCVVIGPLLWLGARWFELKGFERMGVVSIVALIAVVGAFIFSAKLISLEAAATVSGDPWQPIDKVGYTDWRSGVPVLIVGGVVMGAFLALHFFDPNGKRTNIGALYKIEGNAGRGGVEVSATGGGHTLKTYSDAAGKYKFNSVPVAIYNLKAQKSNCSFSPPSVYVKAGPSSAAINFNASCSYYDLKGNQSVSGSVGEENVVYYSLHVPAGAASLRVTLFAYSADLYVSYGGKPAASESKNRAYTKRPRSSEKSYNLNNPRAGEWWIGVRGYGSTTYTLRADILEHARERSDSH